MNTNVIKVCQKWDHKTVLVNVAGVFSGKLKTGAIDEVLTREGEQGWELVSAFQGQNVKATLPGVLLMFKKPRNMGA